MSRLYRGLWQVYTTNNGISAIHPGVPIDYHDAEILCMQLAEDGAHTARLIKAPLSRAPWEFKAPFEASDKPRWGEENDQWTEPPPSGSASPSWSTSPSSTSRSPDQSEVDDIDWFAAFCGLIYGATFGMIAAIFIWMIYHI